ncbi:hypothetical protein BgiBS90_022806, partial [Biomphalaria glabrata]
FHVSVKVLSESPEEGRQRRDVSGNTMPEKLTLSLPLSGGYDAMLLELDRADLLQVVTSNGSSSTDDNHDFN